MKKVSHKNLYVRDPETGEFNPLMAIRGESAYDIAVRLGKFSGTEEEWANMTQNERDAAIQAIQKKGAETLASIPEDYTALAEAVEGKFDKAIIFSGMKPANISTTDITVTFYKHTTFLGNGYEYEILDESITVPLLGWDISTLSIVLLNKNTNAFSVMKRTDLAAGFDLTGYIYVCAIKSSDEFGIISMDWGLPYTVDGEFLNGDIPVTSNVDSVFFNGTPQVTFEMNTLVRLTAIGTTHIFYNGKRYDINNLDVSYVPELMSNYTLFNVVFNIKTNEIKILHSRFPLSDDWAQIGLIYKNNFKAINEMIATDTPGNIVEPKLLVNMLASVSGKFIEIDSKAKTVTFPEDMLVMCKNTLGYVHIGGVADYTHENIISYENINSTAIAIYLDSVDGKLYSTAYNATTPDTYMLLMVIRTTTGIVSTNLPYLWDGKLYNTFDIDKNGDFLPHKSYVKGIAHRGFSSAAPENTIPAYELAKKHGFEYAECDVSFTSDGVAVLLHDNTVDRTSNGTGAISDLTFEQVRALDFGSWYSEEYTGTQIPSFREFIKWCKNNGMHPYIELKTSSGDIAGLVNTVKHYGMAKSCSWISFSATALEIVKNNDKSARLGYVVDSLNSNNITTAQGLKTDFNEVFLDTYGYTTETLNEAESAGLPVEYWTINTVSDIQNLPESVSGVTSDTLNASRIFT